MPKARQEDNLAELLARVAAAALTGAFATVFLPSLALAQVNSLAAKSAGAAGLPKARLIADVPAAGPFYARPPSPRFIQRPETKEFETFDAGNIAGMVGGAIGAGIANQRGFEYYRQGFFFYGHQPYYGSPYYGGPAYYGGLYSPYYYKE